MLGTAGLPHILVRFYTVPDVGAARRSVGWAMLFICLLYFTAPAYAAFSRWEVLHNMVGKRITAVPEWATNWSNAGLLEFTDLTALEGMPIAKHAALGRRHDRTRRAGRSRCQRRWRDPTGRAFRPSHAAHRHHQPDRWHLAVR